MTEKMKDTEATEVSGSRQERVVSFPYGINPEMDDHAAKNGFAHWSCVSPRSNEWWVRKDFRQLAPEFRGAAGYLDDLAEYDARHPMEN